MVESPLGLIIEMIFLIIGNAIQTLGSLFGLFLDLLESLGFISRIGGFWTFLISIVIICVVVFFLGKFFLGVGKQIMILLVIGIILVWILILSLA
jgi:hypothetical protein